MMVWIHGGGLVSGESSDYLPDGLVARKVVVVTINYRLGVLGFLAHPSLTAESPDHASGDYGLLDQQVALRWVRRNIARFGGDPRNVTLFGESAGGLSVHAQLVSPTAHGLFQRAIVESGGYSGSQPSLPAAEAAGTAFAATVGCSSQTAACLRTIPVARLLANQPCLDVTPVVDGKVLTRPITAAFTSGRFNRVPVIEGSNHDEAPVLPRHERARRQRPTDAAGYAAAIAATLASPPPPRPRSRPTTAPRIPSPTIALSAVGTDALFACRARAAAQALSRYVPTYQYEFNDEARPASSRHHTRASLSAPTTRRSSSISSRSGAPFPARRRPREARAGDARHVDDLRENGRPGARMAPLLGDRRDRITRAPAAGNRSRIRRPTTSAPSGAEHQRRRRSPAPLHVSSLSAALGVGAPSASHAPPDLGEPGNGGDCCCGRERENDHYEDSRHRSSRDCARPFGSLVVAAVTAAKKRHQLSHLLVDASYFAVGKVALGDGVPEGVVPTKSGLGLEPTGAQHIHRTKSAVPVGEVEMKPSDHR